MRSENNTLSEDRNVFTEPYVSGVQSVNDEFVAAIHAGQAYEAYDYDGDTANGADKFWLFYPPKGGSGCVPHFGFIVDSSTAARIRVYRNPAINGNGTALAIHNNDHNLPSLTKDHFFKDPSNVSEGFDKIFDIQLGGGNRAYIGGSIANPANWIAKNGNSYLIRMVPQAQSCLMSIHMILIKREETTEPCGL